MTFAIVLVGWVFSLCLHEFSHALVAYYGGDTTVREKGYLTFNPLKYTHPVYSIVLPLLFLVMGGIGLPGGAVVHRDVALAQPPLGQRGLAGGACRQPVAGHRAGRDHPLCARRPGRHLARGGVPGVPPGLSRGPEPDPAPALRWLRRARSLICPLTCVRTSPRWQGCCRWSSSSCSGICSPSTTLFGGFVTYLSSLAGVPFDLVVAGLADSSSGTAKTSYCWDLLRGLPERTSLSYNCKNRAVFVVFISEIIHL